VVFVFAGCHEIAPKPYVLLLFFLDPAGTKSATLTSRVLAIATASRRLTDSTTVRHRAKMFQVRLRWKRLPQESPIPRSAGQGEGAFRKYSLRSLTRNDNMANTDSVAYPIFTDGTRRPFCDDGQNQ